jgi:hypothetical protein
MSSVLALNETKPERELKASRRNPELCDSSRSFLNLKSVDVSSAL